jgi:nitrite reductase (NADH) large subunit
MSTGGELRMPTSANASVGSVVIVGNGIAGLAAAARVRAHHPRCAVHLVGRSADRGYEQAALTRVVDSAAAGAEPGRLPDSWFGRHGITAHLGTPAVSLDVRSHDVLLGTGERLSYDRAILAMGASPDEPGIQGLSLEGVHLVRTTDEVRRVCLDVDSGVRAAIVVGAGELGVQSAAELARMGIRVTVVEPEPWPLPGLGDRRVGGLVKGKLASLGAHLRSGASVVHAYGEDRVVAVGLSDGRRLPCNLLLVCGESHPNVELARAAALQVHRGIVVDETMRTSHPHVFAIGCLAEYRNRIATQWPVSVEQAEIAAEHAVLKQPSQVRRYRAGPPVSTLDLPGLHLVSVGRSRSRPRDHVVVLDHPIPRQYRKIIVAADGTVAGGIAINDDGAAAAIEAAAAEHNVIRPNLADLRAGDLSALEPATRSFWRGRSTRKSAPGRQPRRPPGEQEMSMVDVQRIWRITTPSGGYEVQLTTGRTGQRQVVLEQIGPDPDGKQALELDVARALAETMLEACEVAAALNESPGPR